MLDDIINELKKKIIEELKNDEFNNILKTYIIEPSLCHILDKLYPYLVSCVVIIILLLILLIIILINVYSIKK
jgi:hypothetical protein